MYKRYWIAHIEKNGFDYPIFFYGTEEEMWEYTRFEYGYIPSYSGADDKEVEAGKKLRMKFYLCPEVKSAS